MPARVHAVLVARSAKTTRALLLRTVEAVQGQTRKPDSVTLVFCGDSRAVRESPVVSAAVDAIIEAPASLSFAGAIELALPRVTEGAALWLLAHDTIPEPSALAHLVGALERAPSALVAAPKLLAGDTERLVSLGVSMTRFGRSVELAAEEWDQGQHDGADDALGADVRGLLIRGSAARLLRPDRALAGMDEGLDIGVRARLGGGRLSLAPAARLRVGDDGPASPPTRPTKRAYASRTAQLHRRLVYAHPALVPLHWLSILPLALWRSLADLVGKRPSAILPEWGAALVAMFRVGAVAKSRRRLRKIRTASWAALAPLRVTRATLRQTLDDGHGSEGGAASELRFFSGGGAWAVLAALVISIAAWTPLLAWPTLGGGALLPLRETLSGLWRDAQWGLRGEGVDVVGPADPFAGLLAILGSLWPASPSFALVLLWVLALPLAVLGAWFAATRLTDRSGLRIFAGIAWALAPTFLTALMEGRLTGVLVHLLLPWLFHAGAVAHRSWGAAGAASLVFVAVAACAPSLVPALVILLVLAIIVDLARGRVRSALRHLWIAIPAGVIFVPLIVHQVARGTPWALLGDPGVIWPAAEFGNSVAERLLLVAGFPTADLAGWLGLLGDSAALWILYLCAPLGLLALLAALSPRWKAGFSLLAIALTGIATAMVTTGITVSFSEGVPATPWVGAGLSLAWLGALGAAVVSLDTVLRPLPLRRTAVIVTAAALALVAVPALTALHRGVADISNGPVSTLPAYVAAEARGDQEIGTLVITPQNSGALAVRTVWGSSATLGAQTTLLSTATEPQGRDVAALAVALLTEEVVDAPAELSALGINFVLLTAPADEADVARTARAAGSVALDQRAGFVRVGDTGKGVLWRLDAEPAPRAELTGVEQGTANLVSGTALAALFAALLLALPTRASRRAARGLSRIVALTRGERRVREARAEESTSDAAVIALSVQDASEYTVGPDVREAPVREDAAPAAATQAAAEQATEFADATDPLGLAEQTADRAGPEPRTEEQAGSNPVAELPLVHPQTPARGGPAVDPDEEIDERTVPVRRHLEQGSDEGGQR